MPRVIRLRITKQYFINAGGLANLQLLRVLRDGRWFYYKEFTE